MGDKNKKVIKPEDEKLVLKKWLEKIDTKKSAKEI
jgi:hypothetical protein